MPNPTTSSNSSASGAKAKCSSGRNAPGFVIVDLKQRRHQLDALAVCLAEQWPEAGDAAQFRSALASHIVARPGSCTEEDTKTHHHSALPKTWIAEHDGELIGAISVVQYHRDRRGSVWIANLFVRPGYRGRGLGEALLRQAENCARELKVELLRLATRDRQDYYRARGWRRISDKTLNGRTVTVLGKSLSSSPPARQTGKKP